jgi:hypothetical protein
MKPIMDQMRRLNRRTDSGQTMVEFALAVTLLFLLLFGIIQWGFIFAARLAVRKAAAEGARQAIIFTNANALVSLTRLKVAPILDPTRATATLGTTNMAGTNAVTMTVRYQLRLIFPYVVPGPNPYPLSATVIMQ